MQNTSKNIGYQIEMQFHGGLRFSCVDPCLQADYICLMTVRKEINKYSLIILEHWRYTEIPFHFYRNV